MRKIPVKGTNDYLPEETALRDYIQNTILRSYQSYGFQRIMTPCLEEIENLENSDGGENLKLIFKILKRGEKLASALDTGSINNLSDMGLRYDLTLPLSRFFANNRQRLTLPFKCIQIDKVYRAERPQKGRLRELVQCDIDIIGSTSICCEIELIDATAKALQNVGLNNFSVFINDRRILNEVIASCGFCAEEIPSVCIAFDKYEKIGAEGILDELRSKGFCENSIRRFSSVLKALPLSLEEIKSYCKNDSIIESLAQIIDLSSKRANGQYEIAFDLSLVRGQGYYTGPIFEIKSKDFGSSIAGGGRYDGLIGKFTEEPVPAVGFSIGFERIYCILSERNRKIPNISKKLAVIYRREDILNAMMIADQYRFSYDVSLFEETKKLGKLIYTLKNSGYDGIIELSKSKELKRFS